VSALIVCLILSVSALAQETAVESEQTVRQTEFTQAEEDKINSRVNALSDQLKSPFCPGKTLTTCTSPDALNLRVRMKQMMVDGMTDEAIILKLNEEYGEKLDNPEQPDATVLIYILPLILVSLATLVVFWSWSRGKKNRGFSDALDTMGSDGADAEDPSVREERLAKLRKRIQTED